MCKCENVVSSTKYQVQGRIQNKFLGLRKLNFCAATGYEALA
jgi:hypothetical protein